MPAVEINQSSNRLQLLCKPPRIIYLSNDIMPIHSEHLKSVISRNRVFHGNKIENTITCHVQRETYLCNKWKTLFFPFCKVAISLFTEFLQSYPNSWSASHHLPLCSGCLSQLQPFAQEFLPSRNG
ncbi:hypothetical protein NC653_028738 [Populus alba x Populus x berolinensis]|uniref:Uncharacterized protein n=1 Tax=Populus alba x Populus x berolinensis TaxID=444605 RepID=A0AAD6M0S0_9ROSI|nr:hypothetical protein NC653_028738 [Populus alba x Populus x berolinensis]